MPVLGGLDDEGAESLTVVVYFGMIAQKHQIELSK